MKIIKIGTFDERGLPTRWNIDLGDAPYIASDQLKIGTENEYCLGLDQLFPGSVDVRGVEIVEWTQLRKLCTKGIKGGEE